MNDKKTRVLTLTRKRFSAILQPDLQKADDSATFKNAADQKSTAG
jgi:hypothetical protein